MFPNVFMFENSRKPNSDRVVTTGITALFTLIGQLGQSGDHRYNYIVYTDRTIRTEW